MRIKNLTLKNIGPFKEAFLDFEPDKGFHDPNASIEKNPPVTIITGENGTGKTIVLDAIRAILLGRYQNIERDIIRNINDFYIECKYVLPESKSNFFFFDNLATIYAKKLTNNNRLSTSKDDLNRFFGDNDAQPKNWIINYWTSKLSTDSFNVTNLVAPKPERYLIDSLSGVHKNIEVSQLICYFDYLKSSDNQKEKELGKNLFELVKKIIKISLIDGEFKYVERKSLTPIIHQTGQDITLEKLSSGNLYLIQRLISLLGQMYSVHVLNNTDISELCNTPGLLMIDEAENHLHPKWQKTFINSILEIFPNLQIIATTHSPFIVSSVENAKVFVCKSMKDHSIVVDETEEYSNKPVEEILSSEVFDTNSFNAEISEMIRQRKAAIKSGDMKKAQNLEKKLKEINPSYFSYFDVEKMLEEISK